VYSHRHIATPTKGNTMTIYLETLSQDELDTIEDAYDINVTWTDTELILNR